MLWLGMVVFALIWNSCGDPTASDFEYLKQQNAGRGRQIHELQQEVARLKAHVGLADSVDAAQPASAAPRDSVARDTTSRMPAR